MSSLVSTRSVMPLMRVAYRVIGASYQPTRRGRPVVVPNSKPRDRSHSPFSSKSSVGKGPEPTRVVYAFAMPTMRSRRLGPTPEPVAAPPAVADDDVTKG